MGHLNTAASFLCLQVAKIHSLFTSTLRMRGNLNLMTRAEDLGKQLQPSFPYKKYSVGLVLASLPEETRVLAFTP